MNLQGTASHLGYPNTLKKLNFVLHWHSVSLKNVWICQQGGKENLAGNKAFEWARDKVGTSYK